MWVNPRLCTRGSTLDFEALSKSVSCVQVAGPRGLAGQGGVVQIGGVAGVALGAHRAEQCNGVGIPRDAGVRHDQRPHVWHKEVLRGCLLFVREPKFRELLEVYWPPLPHVACKT
jgi:hypothetical protein